MEGDLSSLLDDQVYPDPVDDLPEPRQLQVDQSQSGGNIPYCLTWGKTIFMFGKLLLDNLLEMDTSGDFQAGHWAENGYRVTLTFWPSNHLFACNN